MNKNSLVSKMQKKTNLQGIPMDSFFIVCYTAPNSAGEIILFQKQLSYLQCLISSFYCSIDTRKHTTEPE